MKKLFSLLAVITFHQLSIAAPLKQFYSPIPTLGGGYSDDMQMPLGMSCLKPGKIEFTGGTKSVITLGKSYQFDEIQKELNVNLSGSGSVSVFSFDASTNYARYISESTYSESFYFLEKILLPTKVLNTDFGMEALNNFGRGAYQKGPDQFRLSCGNKFHQQVTLGANFFTTFKLVFNSAFDKSMFNYNVSTSIASFASAKVSIQSVVQQKNIHGVLEISAYQEGGNPTQLANIFEKCNDHYCVTSCSFENLDACQGTIDGIINYAQNYFPKQIDFNPETKQVEGYANPINYEYMDYTQLGLHSSTSKLTPEILAARQTLGSTYKETLRDVEIIDHVLHSKIAVSIVKEYKDKLRAQSELLHSNAALLSDYNDGAIGCFLNPSRCVEIKDTILSLLKSTDLTVMNMFKTGFIDRSNANSGSPYLVTPIGGNQYHFLGSATSQFLGQATVMLSADKQSLHVDGIDIWQDHFFGDFPKVGDSTYTGGLRYGTGRVITHQFTIVENPI